MRPFWNFIVKLTYLGSLICGVLALGIMFNSAMVNADNIMQQTAMFAFAIGLGVVPYVMARAIEKIFT